MANRGQETETVVLITLGIMTVGVLHDQDSDIAGAENVGDFLKREI